MCSAAPRGLGLRHAAVLLSVCAAVLQVSSAAADLDQRIREYDAKVVAELTAISPEASAAFVAGTAARERGDFEAALREYARARDLAPTSPHPLRRLCWSEGAVGRRVDALGHCREAVSMDPSAANLGALAAALLLPTGVVPPPRDDRAEALRLVQRASQQDPNDYPVHLTMCQAALSLDDVPVLRRGVERLAAIEPEHAMTHYFTAVLAATDGNWSDADRALDRAAGAGLPKPELDRMRLLLEAARPFWLGWVRPLQVAVGAWMGMLVLLLLSGWLSSGAAMRAAAELPRQGSGKPTGAAALATYRVVLWLSCAFYYLSLPLFLAGVLGLGGVIVLGFFILGQIPVKVVLIVGVVTLVTLFSVIKSLFVRIEDEDPGARLDLVEHPRLAEVLREVARRVGSRPVDHVFLTPGTEVVVYERGSLGRRLRGATNARCLNLGVGVLEGMRLVDLKSVMAHEYGHFPNEDIAGGGFALAVRRSVMTSAIAMAQGGAAAWYNPVWWFVRGFHSMFTRISHGAARLQELLADRMAAVSYGPAAFERGLRHVITRTATFDAHAQATLREVLERPRALANLYTYRPAQPPSPQDIERAVTEALDAKASSYDSHPAPADRIAMVRALTAVVDTESDDSDGEQAWSLFAEREALERLMTDRLRDRFATEHGVILANAEPEEDKVRSADA